MSSDNNQSLGSIGAALALGVSLVLSIVLLKGPLESRKFEFRQEGPVFIRFNRANGEMCYTGLAPNGKFATESWLCMAGDKTKAGEFIKPPTPEELEALQKSNKSGTRSSNNKKSPKRSNEE